MRPVALRKVILPIPVTTGPVSRIDYLGMAATELKPRSDETVMQAVREGDTAQLSVLFERHHRALFSYLYRLTSSREQADDLVQDVFLRMLKYRNTYENKSTFQSWMYQVARSAHIDHYRKKRPEVQFPEEGLDPVSAEPRADERIRKGQETLMLQKALAALPVEKRDVLVLSRYQDLKYQEIGKLLGCDANAVKLRVYRAVRSLSQTFAEMSGEKAI